jgi:predicted nucleotidyltransferase
MHHMPQAVSGETLAQCLSHLTPNERAGLAAFIHRLHQDYGANLLRVILFGSKARGDCDDQSDLDVLVVVHISGEDYWQHWRRIVDMAWEVELVLHHSEFDGRALYRVQSGQPMHRRMTSDAPEKVPCDAQR